MTTFVTTPAPSRHLVLWDFTSLCLCFSLSLPTPPTPPTPFLSQLYKVLSSFYSYFPQQQGLGSLEIFPLTKTQSKAKEKENAQKPGIFTPPHDSLQQCNNLDSDMFAAFKCRDQPKKRVNWIKSQITEKLAGNWIDYQILGGRAYWRTWVQKKQPQKKKKNRSRYTEDKKKKNRIGKLFVASLGRKNV